MTQLPFRRLLAHALAWTAFITYEVSIILITSTPRRVFWWEYVGFYGLNILLFYVNAHGVLSFSLSRKRWLLLLLLLTLTELVLYLVGQVALDEFYNQFRSSPKPVELDQRLLLAYIWRGIYFIGLSSTYWFVRRTIETTRTIGHLEIQQLEEQRQRAELEKNLIRAHNAYLQAQINPHFLFNTLNFIYNAAVETAPRVSESVLLLSEVMRHALARVGEDGKTDLSRELEHVEKYIALNRLRFQHPLYLDLLVSGRTDGHRIPPLFLLTFVENVFSHGDLTDALYPARITVRCKHHLLRLETWNRKRGSRHRQGHGLGLQHIRTRLKEYYRPEHYLLDIREDADSYSTHLQLKLA